MCENKIEYRLLVEEDFEVVKKFLEDYFVTREPLMSVMKFSQKELDIFFEAFGKPAALHNVSYGAFDNDQLVGVRLSLLGRKISDILGDISKLPVKIQQHAIFIYKVAGGKPIDICGTENYMSSIVLCTKPDYSNYGIGTKLFKISEKNAKHEGCTKIISTATSAFTYKITNKLGYETVNEIAYKDYVDPLSSERIFENVQEPHVKAVFVVKDI